MAFDTWCLEHCTSVITIDISKMFKTWMFRLFERVFEDKSRQLVADDKVVIDILQFIECMSTIVPIHGLCYYFVGLYSNPNSSCFIILFMEFITI